MLKPDLDAIRQREAAATAGPWRVGNEDPKFKDVLHAHELIISHRHGIVELEPSRNGAADTAFIAHAREDVPALLDAFESAVALIRDLVDADDCWFDHHGGCQAHGYLSLEPGELCPHAEAKALISQYSVDTGSQGETGGAP